MLDVIADTWRAPTDEPVVKCGARVVVAPFFLRGDETHPGDCENAGEDGNPVHGEILAPFWPPADGRLHPGSGQPR